jgi:hypothetical protein
MHRSECVEGKLLRTTSPHILLYHWSEEACTLPGCILRENGRSACAK